MLETDISVDVWSEYGNLIYPYLDEGMTIYGEIFGYETGLNRMIQKNYDYGCDVGENKLMPYRITTTNDDGTKREWDVAEVIEWTEKVIKENPTLENKIHVMDLLYHGTLKDLYPHLPIDNHWHEDVLLEMEKDKKHFGMEQKEPLCKNKVWREGICLRIDGDPIRENFKLKCMKFLKAESDLMSEIENGNEEIPEEMMETYN